MTVLNLAPPVQDAGKKVEDMSTHVSKAVAAVKYITHQATDGTAIYEQNRRKFKDTFFQRIKPLGLEASSYKLDCIDVLAMILTMANEWANADYFCQLLIAAVMIALRAIKEASEDHLDMFIQVLRTLRARRESHAGIHLGTQLLAKQPGKDFILAQSKSFSGFQPQCKHISYYKMPLTSVNTFRMHFLMLQ